jgi:hypothetical protein
MSEVFGGDIKQGMIFGVFFPLALILALLILKAHIKNKSRKTAELESEIL